MRALLLRAGMMWYGARLWRPVERMAGRPGAAQADTLRRIVRANRDTGFGRAHGFRDISDVDGFQRSVPVQDYEHVRPYIEEQRLTGRPALTAEPPLFYAQTSGSTAAPKHIPVTATSLALHRREQALFSYLQFHACPAAFAGKAWGIMGAAVEGRLDSGHVVGSVSGHLYESLPRTIRSRFVVPPAVATIPDYEVKYRTILALALAEPAITYLGTPNPSTFLRLLGLMNSERHALLDVVATGRLDAIEGIPPHVMAQLRVRPSPARADVLRRLSTLTYANAWPGIRLVTTWTGGSCGIALATLRRELPAGAAVMELGYQATEVRGTIAIDPNTSAGLPALHHHFFEFAEQSAWDAGDRTCLTLDQLEDGRQYYVIVTTAAGLYRYFMNDLLKVDGRVHGTPLLAFMQKGKGVTSLTGEKLYEAQAIAAVQQGARELALEPAFFLMVANEQRGGYELFIEVESTTVNRQALADGVDRQLGLINLEYEAKRASGRLNPLTVTFLRRGAAEAHKASCLRAGQREAQFKPVILQYAKDLRWQADEYAVS
jgi:hypothetical protein